MPGAGNHCLFQPGNRPGGTIFSGNSVEKPVNLAILPFIMHTPDDVSHSNRRGPHAAFPPVLVKHGPGGPQTADRYPLNDRNEKDRNQLIRQVAEQTGSDFILDGSITKLAGSFSIDAMVYDMKNRRYMAFLNNPKTVTNSSTK